VIAIVTCSPAGMSDAAVGSSITRVGRQVYRVDGAYQLSAAREITFATLNELVGVPADGVRSSVMRTSYLISR
jgi:hypothetical protein